MYGKIFESIYDGTLADDWQAMVTFQQLIVICDADGVVDMTPSAISRRTSIPIEHIEAGLERLEKPDPNSRTPDEDGCRIKLIDGHRQWGWYIVNHRKYRDLADAATVRDQTRQRVKRHREAKADANKDVTACNGTVTPSNASNAIQIQDTNTNTDSSSKHSVEVSTVSAKTKAAYSSDFEEFWLAYPSDRRGNKKRAFAEWKKVTADKQFVIGDIKHRVQCDRVFTDDQGKFVPHAERWLSGERWETGIKQDSGFGDVNDKNIRVGLDWVENGL